MSVSKLLFILIGPVAVFAWDAGPAACKHNECTGGVNADRVLDTQPKYAASQLPSDVCPAGKELYGGLCYSACASGWHRTAVCTCKKNGGSIFDLWTDCGRFGNATVPNKVCPAGTDSYGGLCYAGCPPGSVRTAVSTCAHDVKWRSNTHLWVVNRALDVLSRTNDPVAAKAVQRMRDSRCRTQWEDGLWSADSGDLAETGGARGTHFYNGAGRDFFGNLTRVITYLMPQADTRILVEQNAQGNARDQARKYAAKVGSVQTDQECYQLGLALHFLTDMTQPMHSSGHSAMQIPLSQHPAFEDSVGMIQARFPGTAAWDRRWQGKTPDEVFHETSVRANSFAPAIAAALRYDGTICTMTTEPIGEGMPVTYTGHCFLNQASMIARTGEVLLDAYQSTAGYLYSIFRTLPS